MSTIDRVFDRIVRTQFRRKRSIRIAALGVGIATTAIIGTIHYTVKPGDSLSEIASKACDGKAADWTGIYQQNLVTVGSNPNLIYPGEHLTFHCDAAAITVAMAAPQDPPATDPPANTTSTSYSRTPTTYSGSGSMQACIIARESGGNSQIMNSTGHYGLYQFSSSTWAAHGGNPADFGNASISEQNQVYYNTVAQDGYSDWAPYDGC